MVLENLLDPIFNPLLKMPPILAIFLIALIITVIITLVYKYTTDQKKMKRIKEEMKEQQKKMKVLSKSDPKKAMELQQQAMKGNMDYMKSSMKVTLYTFIPIIIIFGWLNSHMAYYPLEPNQTFEITAFFDDGHSQVVSLSAIPDLEIIGNATQKILDNKAIWELKGEPGEYVVTINYNNEENDKNIIISHEREYKQPEKKISDSKLKKIVVGNEKVYPIKDLFGLKINWLWTYIIFSFAISIGLRKLLKVY